MYRYTFQYTSLKFSTQEKDLHYIITNFCLFTHSILNLTIFKSWCKYLLFDKLICMPGMQLFKYKNYIYVYWFALIKPSRIKHY